MAYSGDGVLKAREETISFDFTSGMDNDQLHQPELPRKDAQLLESGFLLPQNKELHWKRHAILEVMLSLFTSLKTLTEKVSFSVSFLPFV